VDFGSPVLSKTCPRCGRSALGPRPEREAFRQLWKPSPVRAALLSARCRSTASEGFGFGLAVVTYRPRAPGVISSALRMRGAAAECGRGGCSTSLSYACVGCVVGTRVVACGRWLGVWWAS